MESDLTETAERIGIWPDESYGPFQQTVAYAPIGDQSASAENIALVRRTLTTNFDYALEIAARQYAGYWRQYGDPLETLSRYNGGPGMAYADNPNAVHIRDSWARSAAYEVPDVPSNTALRQQFLDTIRGYFGRPYVFGGKSPATSFDCSGLLTYCGRQCGVDLGDPMMTSADALKDYCDPVDASTALPGDLLLFSQTYGGGGRDYATHCGASLGAGTFRMLDTHGDPWPGCGETDISTAYWQAHLMGVWRPRAFAQSPAPEEDDLSQAERDELAQLREVKVYCDTLTSSILPSALGTIEAAAKDGKGVKWAKVREQCAAVRQAAGI